MPGLSPTQWALLPLILAVVWILPEKLERRDAALNIVWPRIPIPENGRMTTIRHSQEDIERFVHKEGNQKNLLIAPQVDMYYEVHYTEGCTAHFVVLSGTNGQSWFYAGLIDQMRSLGFCTLVFDWRSHGRTEDTPGDISTELFMLDAAALIQKVFPNQPVHLFGWSLGGFIGYQLAIYKPELVKSLVVHGSNACFAPIPEGRTECEDQWRAAPFIFSRGSVMRLIGLEAEVTLIGMVAKLKQPIAEPVKRYFWSLRMDQKVKTPRVWLQVQGAKTFSQLDRISCPFQQIVGEHEIHVTGATKHSMELEAAKISKAEPPIVLKDPAGEGYSHFALYEEGGLDLIVGHLRVFYQKHA